MECFMYILAGILGFFIGDIIKEKFCNKTTNECAGILEVIKDDEGAYLFVKFENPPDELVQDQIVELKVNVTNGSACTLN